MCGIAGQVGPDDPERHAICDRMIAKLRHRGPDHQAVLDVPGACLAHTRLSILDLSPLGHQPMQDPSGRYTITYNGEVYNFRALRRELEPEISFRSRSDTEVVLQAFIRWGTHAFDRFDGMFALAIWDARERELHIARDRFGEKPLFYTEVGGRFTFASEVRALLCDPRISTSASLSIPALNHFLAMGYILHPLTMYAQIASLPPATYAVYRDGALRAMTRYWDYRAILEPRPVRDARTVDAELEARLGEAVRSRLESDVPVGAFLSGGLDSSGIVALTRRVVPGELHTFTVRFAEGAYNEADDAAFVARTFRTCHHELEVTGPFRERIDRSIHCYDQPFSDTSLVPMVAVAEEASRHVKVVLSGDAADEVLAGYPTYVADAIRRGLEPIPWSVRQATAAWLRRLPARRHQKTGLSFRAAQFGRGLAQDPCRAHYAWRELHSLEDRIALLGVEHAEEIRASDPEKVFRRHYDEAEGLDWLARQLYVDAKTWLVDDILVKADRATMAVSLESRAPFLARELVEFIGGLPSSLKLRGLRGKYVLRRALRHVLPRQTLRKRKAGFNAPISLWLGNHSPENEFRFFNRYVARRCHLPIDEGRLP
jgi:asparagine synthase (glutamine-hydrolysing)